MPPQDKKQVVELELPNGQIAEIEVPEGASQAQIQLSIKAFRAKNPSLFGTPDQPRRISSQELPNRGRIPDPAQALPTIGAMVGSVAGASYGGPVGGIGGATVGGEAGEAAKQLIHRAVGMEAPKTSTEAATSMATEGAIQGVGEAVFVGVPGASKWLVNKAFNRVTSRKAATMIANELSDEALSPAQFGSKVQSAFDLVRKKAGEGIEQAIKRNPQHLISTKNTIVALEAAREKIFQDVGEATARAADSPIKKTVDIIENQLSQLKARQGQTTFHNMWERDSALASVGQGLDPGLSSKINSDIRRAIDNDIKQSLGETNPIYSEFKAARQRFAELSELGRADVLSKVFGNERISLDKVRSTLASAPEDSLRAIQLINKRGEEFAIKNVRRAMFLELFENGGKFPSKASSEMVREVYGSSAAKVEKFFDVMSKGTRRGSIINFGRLTLTKGSSLGASDESGPLIEIPVKRLAAVLDDPSVLEPLTKLATAPEKGQQAAQALRALLASLQALGGRGRTAEGASIEEQLKEKERRMEMLRRKR